MIFRQLFDKTSCTYTYLIASKKGREALIIDPVLENVQRYIRLIKELNLKLVELKKLKLEMIEAILFVKLNQDYSLQEATKTVVFSEAYIKG